ncbi:hypothetical protein LL037_19520 [Clostridium estertheticum]|uniref:Uncharacterized protein n=1 Tax=Clostridium estertheticum TaxID=238834 RepID=A0AA47EJX4_9CLOT|nr:hypothetical protein [Clostridium estertheticum]MBU3155217.1 hypothetical protein [Clostridium estertheticum]MBU3198658.1 hypothetical protein [Clostridium estertheticum]WAG61271.1 hypothetical protein LL038_03185 [Clostridium estertheticum]WAG64633.1 hypothetical protein LL037_19520 [Clostridium estertheticum]
MQTKKGFILIYTILVGLVCLTIMMYIFDVQLSEVRYSTSNKKHVLKDDNYQRDKEYLMTLFFKYIDENEVQIKQEGINKFLFDNLSSSVKYGDALVTHTNSTNEFIFITSYDTLNNRHDYFILEDIEKKVKLIFIKTKYLKK